ncbi:MAG: bifunctional nuclease family protein [Fimbriimonadales bacterium]|nr:bifunctional nuclease family protein [Fimbriimonadales bacterium]
MRDDERKRRYDEDPDDEFEDLFENLEDDDPLEGLFEEDDEENLEEIEAQLKRLFGGEAGSELEERAARLDRGRELEVRVSGVYERIEHGQPRALLVQLRDNYGRSVPIVIGPFEAHAIITALNDDTPPRPMTHDLIRNILTRLGASIDRVLIDDLWQGTFYAKIYLLHGDEEIEIDSRPSDAIALALRFRAPIYMAESVLEAEGQPEDYS